MEAEVIALARPEKRDFVNEFMLWTEGLPTPELFRLWSGITCIAGALERRCWVELSNKVLYPNLYTMLVCSPGIGKTVVMDAVKELLESAKLLHMAPDSATAASMLNDITASKRTIVHDGKIIAEYHSMTVLSDEFSVFCPSYDLEFLGRLNYIYNNPRTLRVTRVYLDKEVNILHPQLNILAGAQPALLGSMLPDEAWSSGTMSRMIMVYAGSSPKQSLFSKTTENLSAREFLLNRVSELAKLRGKFFWEKDAAQMLDEWHMKGGPPAPTHAKLIYYSNRRTTLHAPKLAMIASAARGSDLRITTLDVQRAISWLVMAEQVMPEIFKEMFGKNDGDLIREMHYFLWNIWLKEKRDIHEARIINFLKDRAPREKIVGIIEIACRANILRAGKYPATYSPVPIAEHGMLEA